MSGKTWDEVAKQMGKKSGQAASQLVERTIKEIYGPKATEYLNITLARLEALIDAVWERALNGETESHEQARKVVADIRKMLGQDKPSETIIGGPNGAPVVTVNVEAALDKLAERLKK